MLDIKKLTLTEAEESFCMYKLHMKGSFKTKLYDLFWLADTVNKQKLITAFPYIEICKQYAEEEGYWEDLKLRWNYNYPDNIIYE